MHVDGPNLWWKNAINYTSKLYYIYTKYLIGLSILHQIITVVTAMTVIWSKVTLESTNEQANERGKNDLRIRAWGSTGLFILATSVNILVSISYDL